MWRLLQGSSPLLCNLREDSFEALFVNTGVCIKTPACSSPPLSQSHVKSEIRPEISGFSFLRCQGLQVSQPTLCHVYVWRGVTRHNVNIVTAGSSLRLHLNWDQLEDKAHFSLHRTQFWYRIAEGGMVTMIFFRLFPMPHWWTVVLGTKFAPIGIILKFNSQL